METFQFPVHMVVVFPWELIGNQMNVEFHERSFIKTHYSLFPILNVFLLLYYLIENFRHPKAVMRFLMIFTVGVAFALLSGFIINLIGESRITRIISLFMSYATVLIMLLTAEKLLQKIKK